MWFLLLARLCSETILTIFFASREWTKANSKTLTALLFITRICPICWSQFIAVFSTVDWWRIGAASCQYFYTSSTRHTAFRNRPVGVTTIHRRKTGKIFKERCLKISVYVSRLCAATWGISAQHNFTIVKFETYRLFLHPFYVTLKTRK